MTLIEAKHICSVDYVSGIFLSLREAYLEMAKSLGEAEAKSGYERCVSRLIYEFVTAHSEGYLTNAEFSRLLKAMSTWRDANETYFAAARESVKQDVVAEDKEISAFAGLDPSEGAESYRLGCVLIPDNLDSLPLLAPRKAFVAPATIDLRDYCTPTRDQGKNPWCAAFAATSFAANVLWRRNDSPEQFDPSPVYACAKTIDGAPEVDGTSLTAVLQALLANGVFDKSRCEPKILRTAEQVKYAVHKFGCCLAGLNVSKEWYSCNKNKSTISGQKNAALIGGHAVLVCGYTRDGIIIQNSWGKDWGSYGFALVTWKEFEREFMYGAVLDNCLYDMRMLNA